MPADHHVIDADESCDGADCENNRQRRKTRGKECEPYYVCLTRSSVAVEQRRCAFPIHVTRSVHRAALGDNQISHCLGVTFSRRGKGGARFLTLGLTIPRHVNPETSSSSRFNLTSLRYSREFRQFFVSLNGSASVAPAGKPNSYRESGTDRGARCAASGAFNGSSPTANLVSIIKGQRKS